MCTKVKIIIVFWLLFISLMLLAFTVDAQVVNGATPRNAGVMVDMAQDTTTGEWLAVIVNSSDCISQIEIRFENGNTVVTPVMPDGSFNYKFDKIFYAEVRNLTPCMYSALTPLYISSSMKAHNILTGELFSNPKRKIPECEKTIRPIKFPNHNPDRDTTVATKM